MTSIGDPKELLDELRWLSKKNEVAKEWRNGKNELDSSVMDEFMCVLFDDLHLDKVEYFYDLTPDLERLLKTVSLHLSKAIDENERTKSLARFLEDPDFLIAQKLCELITEPEFAIRRDY